jgi:hypothetical protein
MRRKKTFLISPVRDASDKKLRILAKIVEHLENNGWDVHWPYRDTEQTDPTGGLRICEDNMDAIAEADVVHFVWDGTSKGSLFDLGMAFSMAKRIIPLVLPPLTKEKSFQNMVWRYYQKKEKQTQDMEEWMLEMLNTTDEDEQQLWDNTLMDGLEDEVWIEDEEYDIGCCTWMRHDIQESSTLSHEYFRSLSIDDEGNYSQDNNYYIRGNPCPVHHCPGCGRKLDDE